MFELAENAWQVYSVMAVFILYPLCFLRMFKYFAIPNLIGFFLVLWHLVFCIGYLAFTYSQVADAKTYYLESLDASGGFAVGTQFVIVLASIFSDTLGLSYLGVFLVFNLFGTVGLLAFYASLRKVVAERTGGLKWLAFLFVLLPSISFWSSAIGKDGIAFMSVGLSLWASMDLNKRKGLMLCAIAAMFLVRPHMAGLMVAALGGAIFFDQNTKLVGKLVIGLAALGAALLMVPFAIKYAGLVDLANILDYINQRQGFNQGGGSSLDIRSMSLPMQLFTYAFRPLPWEAHNPMALFSSFENVLILSAVSLGLFGSLRWGVDRSHANVLFLSLYLFMAWGILAVTTANLGIAVRQKWMFMPYLIFLVFCCLQRIPFSFGYVRSTIPAQSTT